ncbi:MBOAT family O-acyltransferase [Myroides odoratimimus]|uniref:MBOAT family O-acyltransferase n=1 Tax=Myroides odoratimimus TaxID=76832 RepID=UPI00257880C4|nr:MBOAT family O-acyltransferase [Myroides odoratimimus]MDM1396569.1 MBOAT family protein [Myroides odoratimimus]MDM1451160.1 MBOAT family protein [Myroides odoratimimus]MDM1496147.1 MBOAT family protein [Myroides odoratimimus]MDM1529931.1 MBOAT family protein [Myroides odoratimimus]
MSLFNIEIPSITIDQVINWFTFNPKEPLLFNSGLFLGIFIVFYLFYILMRKTFHIRLLYVTLFSLFFYYKSSGMYFIILIGSSLMDYYFANIINHTLNAAKKKLLLTISIVVNLGLLGYFKYTNFFLDGVNFFANTKLHLDDIILPVGISFFTFQSISYIIEIYRKEIEPTKNFLDYLFFISFFPQLVAGPIVRAKDFLPQIYKNVYVSRDYVNEGLLLIIGGLLKKAVISDYISINFVDRVFDAPNSYTAFENLMASYGYAIQIYCDFSGYSDMAIGIALLMGYRLPVNFDVPYQSMSITEFWRRWHISLSTWLKDFLYISVGGNRKGSFGGYFFPGLFFVGILGWGIYYMNESIIPLILAVASIVVFGLTFLLAKDKKKNMYTNFNLLTTMLLGGLWHGASLRFIVWGALHGIALAIHKIIMELFPRAKGVKPNFLWRIFSIFLTFNFVTFCWIFFRATSFDTALNVINNIASIEFDWQAWTTIAMGYKNAFMLIGIGFVWHYIPKSWMSVPHQMFNVAPMFVKAVVLGFVFWIVYATATAGPQPFIYFQF